MRRRSMLAAGLAAPLAGGARAQGFPARPLRLVIPYPAGGTTDVIARALQGPLQEALGQPVVIDNRGGGAGAIGMNEVARAPADGHTLVISNNGPTSILPALLPAVGYDGLGSFTPVVRLSTAPLVVVVHPLLPVESLAELVAHGRSRPGRLSYASAGVGSLGHLSSVRFLRLAGIEAVHVPYRGQAATTTSVLTGETQLLISSSSSAMAQFVAERRLRLLAVTSPQPSALFPGVPTAGEMLPGFAVQVWFGLLGPAGLPTSVVQRLNAVVAAALATREVAAQFLAFGQLADGGPPEALRAEIAGEMPLWAATAREGNVRIE